MKVSNFSFYVAFEPIFQLLPGITFSLISITFQGIVVGRTRKKDKVVTFKLEGELLSLLKIQAVKEGRSASAIIRESLVRRLALKQ